MISEQRIMPADNPLSVTALSDKANHLIQALATPSVVQLVLRLALAVLVLLVGLRIAIGLGWRPDEIYSVELSLVAVPLSRW